MKASQYSGHLYWINHEFILSELVAVANTTDLLHRRTFPSVEDTLPLTLRFFNTWKNSSLMNSSKHSAHLYLINSWIETFWAHCSGKFTVWLHLDIFSPMKDALPQTTRLLDIWKAGFAIKASQHSGRLYWIKPRTDTFWAHYSDTWCCLTPTGHVSTYGRRSTVDNKALQHSENQYCHEQQSVFSPFLLIKPSSAHFHCTFCYYWCILRFDIGLDGFSVTGFSMAGYYNLEAVKDNKLCGENASNLDQQLIIIVITYLI